MKIERVILFVPAVLVVGLSLIVMGHRAKAAAPPQAKGATAPAKMKSAGTMASGAGAVSIPDTVLAINSDKAM